MERSIIASHFFPDNFWLIIGAILAMAALSIGLSFWAAIRFGGSRMWVVGGMFVGGIGAASWHFAFLPIGVAVGAVVGCVAGIVAAMLEH